MLTTSQFANDFVDDLVDQGLTLSDAAALKTTLAAQLTDWLGGGDAIPADLAYRLTAALALVNAETASRLDWLTGTATGGPASDGYYSATTPDGAVVAYPCLAKIIESTAKGDPGGVNFTFSTATTDSDPGVGALRLNNATVASVDKIFFDNTAESTASVTGWLDAFDDVAGAWRGFLHLQEVGSEKFLIFKVTGDIVDGTGYRKVPVSYVSGAGGFTNAGRVAVLFVPRGDRGGGLLTGSGAPSGGLGSDGDTYIDLASGDFYGPKASGSWGSPTASGFATLTSATPSSVGASNDVGSATTAARADHTHDHGTQTSGTLHAAATTSVNGFMSAADKTKLNGITPAATANVAASAAPATIGASNVVGVATDYARQDHTHAHGSQTDPTQHALATTTSHGFMSSTDKTDLAAVASLGVSPTATFKGRATSGTGAVEDLTGTQATALLNVASSSLKGLLPAPGANVGQELLPDATWGFRFPAQIGTTTVGLTGRTSAARLAKNIAVAGRDFGLALDGTTDDGPALNAIIQAMGERGGGIIEIATDLTAGSIHLRHNSTIDNNVPGVLILGPPTMERTANSNYPRGLVFRPRFDGVATKHRSPRGSSARKFNGGGFVNVTVLGSLTGSGSKQRLLVVDQVNGGQYRMNLWNAAGDMAALMTAGTAGDIATNDSGSCQYMDIDLSITQFGNGTDPLVGGALTLGNINAHGLVLRGNETNNISLVRNARLVAQVRNGKALLIENADAVHFEAFTTYSDTSANGITELKAWAVGSGGADTTLKALTFTGGGGTGAAGFYTVADYVDDDGNTVSGAVDRIFITNVGSGYSTPPTVGFGGTSPPSGASASAFLSGGSIGTFLTNLVRGSGGTNTSTYALAFSGGAGTGAAGVFTVRNGKVDSYKITNPGTGYTSNPTVSFAAASGLTGASATAVRGAIGLYGVAKGKDNRTFQGCTSISFDYFGANNSIIEGKNYPGADALGITAGTGDPPAYVLVDRFNGDNAITLIDVQPGALAAVRNDRGEVDQGTYLSPVVAADLASSRYAREYVTGLASGSRPGLYASGRTTGIAQQWWLGDDTTNDILSLEASSNTVSRLRGIKSVVTQLQFWFNGLFTGGLQWGAGVAQTLLGNGYMSIDATSNTVARIRYQGSDGTVRSANIDISAGGSSPAALTSTAPNSVGTANSVGVATTAARQDHTHDHGAQTSGTLHAAATTSVAGFLSASDKTKLDGIASGATNTALTSTAPNSVGTANSVGVATTAARQDHTHDHGAQTSGTLHAAATTSVAGFLSASDKTKLDGIASGATNTALTSTAPNSVGTANSVGVATTAARQDHTHSHGNQTSGTLHAAATTSVAGFMSTTDKTKLDAVSSATPVSGSASFGGATIANGSIGAQGITVAGATAGDLIVVGTSFPLQNCTAVGFVLSTNTVQVVFTNNTGANVTLASGTVYARAYKF